MNQSGTRFAEVAVLGGDSAIPAAVRDAGGAVVPVRDADAVVAVGEHALRQGADACDAPILPVGIGESPHSVDQPAATDAVARLVSEGGLTVQHPRLAVAVDGEPVGDALLDVALVTGTPGKISGYAVRLDGERLDEFRADAVVAATPLGSGGYAAAAGGPKIAAGTGLVVLPVAPFTTRSDTWVVPDEVTLSVERDEGPVDLVIDDRVRETVSPHEPVSISVAGSVALIRVP